jgi:hypothetical protein
VAQGTATKSESHDRLSQQLAAMRRDLVDTKAALDRALAIAAQERRARVAAEAATDAWRRLAGWSGPRPRRGEHE